MLSLLGVPELIAKDRADYAGIAGRLAGDEPWRRDLRGRIASGHARLFDTAQPIERMHSIVQAEASRST
jgi:predicted O-linked N-acetylglucosamine transferase (SPINDLY family)